MSSSGQHEDLSPRVRLMRLNALFTGLAAGILLGTGLFVATNWLVVKGGPVVGPHLRLLGEFFIGYDVSFVGSLIGFAYAFVVGLVAGAVIAGLYNVLIGAGGIGRMRKRQAGPG